MTLSLGRGGWASRRGCSYVGLDPFEGFSMVLASVFLLISCLERRLL